MSQNAASQSQEKQIPGSENEPIFVDNMHITDFAQLLKSGNLNAIRPKLEALSPFLLTSTLEKKVSLQDFFYYSEAATEVRDQYQSVRRETKSLLGYALKNDNPEVIKAFVDAMPKDDISDNQYSIVKTFEMRTVSGYNHVDEAASGLPPQKNRVHIQTSVYDVIKNKPLPVINIFLTLDSEKQRLFFTQEQLTKLQEIQKQKLARAEIMHKIRDALRRPFTSCFSPQVKEKNFGTLLNFKN